MASKDLELADEQTAQRLYSQKLEAKSRQLGQAQDPTSNPWTRTGMSAKRPAPTGQLIGRVALVSPDPDLGGRSDFYIGETRANSEDMQVFSWAAPVSCTFFRGARHHEWCEEVAVIRAFMHRNGKIADFADDFVRDDAPAEPFRKRDWSIPSAPPGRRRQLPKPTGRPRTTREAKAETLAAPSTPPVRAEELLRAQLHAPRTTSLAPVLATLQPDQYELVTVPAMESMIIEGQPGTGKTIIASHRAAYLINEETPRKHTVAGNILLVGPTLGYTRHVADVVDRLTGGTDRVAILALPYLMRIILGLRNEPGGLASRDWRDVNSMLGMLARSAIQRLKAARRGSDSTLSTEGVYEYLRLNGVPSRWITTNPEWSAYLRSLPPYKNAVMVRAHTPLLAFIKCELAMPALLDSIEHIIVDEAQDVTPLEWLLLDRINETHTWTLLGDLNQRRSDHSSPSWSEVLDVLGLTEEEIPTKKLLRGYRSTKPILRYANRLLPSSERALLAFQTEGPEARVEQVPVSLLGKAVVVQIDRLLGAYPAGTLAVISPDTGTVEVALRSVGWATVRLGSHVWERNGRTVAVTDPDAARGLEFDAVIVVEPADFPKNLGRRGPLYTALTRANRELAVVHTKPLPDPLRRSSGSAGRLADRTRR